MRLLEISRWPPEYIEEESCEGFSESSTFVFREYYDELNLRYIIGAFHSRE